MTEGVIGRFLAACSSADSIEIIGDLFIPGGEPFISDGGQLGLAKSVYAEFVTEIGRNFESDRDRLSYVGAAIGVHDMRAWSHRRVKGVTLPLVKEQLLCHLGLTANPKCAGAFENLRFILKGCKDTSIIDTELAFCGKLTGLRPRNALLWRHRVWLSRTFGTAERELIWAEEWVKRHPADSSAFYFIETMMRTDRTSIVEALVDNTKALFNLPGHESLWHHRRFLLQHLAPELSPPADWKLATAPTDEFTYPGCANDYVITTNYTRLCDAFGIDINLVLVRSDSTDDRVKLDLAIEDVIVAIARSDTYPTEYEKQKECAERHMRWLRCQLMKMLKQPCH